MWVKFDLQGMKFEFKVEKHIPNQTIDGKWAEISFGFKFKNIIKYSTYKNEVLLSSEVDDIRDYMEKLLEDKLDKEVFYKCIEPDFEFIFSPKYDVRNDPDVIWVKSGNEIRDIEMKLKVNLWNDGLTCNYFSTSFARDEIEIFYLYLSLIINKIYKNDDRINKLLKTGIIYDDNE